MTIYTPTVYLPASCCQDVPVKFKPNYIAGPTPHRVNLAKMRKQLYRNIPSNTERTFDPLSETYQRDYGIWANAFLRQMKAKHGDSLVQINAFVSHVEFGHETRIQLTAVTD